MGKQRGAAGLDVGQDVDQQPGGRGDACGAPEYEQRAVEHGAQQHTPDLRLAVRRQLQRERGGHALEQRPRQQPGGGKGRADAQQDGGGEQQRREPGAPAAHADKEHRDHGDQRRETAVAGHEAVGQHGDEPFARAVDDPAADDPRRITAKPHAHGWLITECERRHWGGCRCSTNTPRPPARAVSPDDLWGSSMLHTVSENDYRQRLESISLRPRQSSARQ